MLKIEHIKVSTQMIYFLNKNTPDEFAKAVITLWRNKNLGKSFTYEAKKYLRENNWKKEERKYIELAKQLLSE